MSDTAAFPAPNRTESLRVPPHSVEAEQSVIGGLLLDNRAWEQIADRIIEQDFYRNDHRLIFAAIRSLEEKNQPFDAVTLSQSLEQTQQRGQHHRVRRYRARAFGTAATDCDWHRHRQRRIPARRA
jgi:replicative DNA helicase